MRLCVAWASAAFASAGGKVTSCKSFAFMSIHLLAPSLVAKGKAMPRICARQMRGKPTKH
jgi:hypothetical protein